MLKIRWKSFTFQDSPQAEKISQTVSKGLSKICWKSFTDKGISPSNLRASVSRLQISTFEKTRLVTPRSRTDLSSWRILRQTLNAVDRFESHFSLQGCQYGLSCDVFVQFLRQVCRSLGNGRSFETRKSFPQGQWILLELISFKTCDTKGESEKGINPP